MTSVILFTSGHHTQPVVDTLKKAKNIKLIGVYKSIASLPSTPRGAGADVFIVADFGQIIPKKILKLPKYGTLCLHPSLLPKYRGPSPVQQAIIDNEKETGVTIFKMDEKVDHGPIIAQFKEKISNDDTAETLYERLFKIGAEISIPTIKQYVEWHRRGAVPAPAPTDIHLPPKLQDHQRATYTKRLSRQDGKINWQWPPEKIERFIRAMTPWPSAWCKGKPPCPSDRRRGEASSPVTIKVLKAHLKDGKLIPDFVQLPGKKPISWKAFLAGHKDWRLI